MSYLMTIGDDGSTATASITIVGDDGTPRIIGRDHPHFTEIGARLLEGQSVDDLLDLLAPDQVVERVISEIGDDLYVADGTLYLRGDSGEEDIELHDSLANTIVRYHREGRDVSNLAAFLMRVRENPSYNSRQQLFTWAQAKDLTINEDGMIIAYKGVDPQMLSIHSGAAYVDGELVEGKIPNVVGTEISMDRSEVNDNPNEGCSHGLHVGTWAYARGFGSILLEVEVDPADVVSVPADSSYQKMRTCRYVVLDVHESDEDDLSEYEPVSTKEFEEEAAFEKFEEVVPKGFIARLRESLGIRRN